MSPTVPKILPIFQYHSVAEENDAPRFACSFVTPADFASQVAWLRENGYAAVTLAQAFTLPLPARAVVFTFDDGYEDVYQHALPVLAEAGWQATVFCCPGLSHPNKPAGTERWGAPLMSHARMRELSSLGWEIAGHTLTHPKLPTLDRKAQETEILGGKKQLEKITGQTVATFAYPHGLYDATCLEIAKDAGFVCAVGIGKGNRHRESDRFRLRRVYMRTDTQGAKLAHRLGFWYDFGHRLRQRLGREKW